jgi:hypothetical protein
MLAISAIAFLLAPVPIARTLWVRQSAFGLADGEYLRSIFVQAFSDTYVGLAAVLAFTAAIAVLVGSARSGLAPRPAAWLALVSAFQVADRFLLNSGRFSLGLLALSGMAFEVAGYIFRPTLSALGMLATLACLVTLHSLRRSLPVWSKILLLGVMAMALLWGPWREGLNHGATTFGWRDSPALSWFWTGPVQWLGWVPFTAATAATWLDFRRWDRPRWRLTEWAGVASALLLILSGVIAALRDLLVRGPKALAEVLYAPAPFLSWWVVVFVLCCLLVRRVGPSWTRWLSPPEVVPTLDPGSASPAGASGERSARMDA